MKTCTGDCLQCPAQQRVYCAAQLSRNNVETLKAMEGRIAALEDVIVEIDGKIDRLSKKDDGDVFNPMQAPEREAQ